MSYVHNNRFATFQRRIVIFVFNERSSSTSWQVIEKVAARINNTPNTQKYKYVYFKPDSFLFIYIKYLQFLWTFCSLSLFSLVAK